MSETFAAVSDALRRSAVPTYRVAMKRTPDLPRPWYLPPLPPPSKASARARMDALIRKGRRPAGRRP